MLVCDAGSVCVPHSQVSVIYVLCHREAVNNILGPAATVKWYENTWFLSELSSLRIEANSKFQLQSNANTFLPIYPVSSELYP